ncbi:MAG TPA: PadR family transcriptional regulator [Actinomycetales bacterium]
MQLRKGVLQFCVLACLRKEPSYGLAIASELSRRRNLFESEGTLYPLLSRLRKQGLVETTWRDSTAGPPRRYYSLTPAGHEALTEFAATWQPFSHEVTEMMGQAHGTR